MTHNFTPQVVALLILFLVAVNGQAGLSVARACLAATSIGSKIVFAGGDDSGSHSFDTVDIYDAATDTWNSTSSGAGHLSAGRTMLIAVSLGEKLFYAGGNAEGSSTVDVYARLPHQETSSYLLVDGAVQILSLPPTEAYTDSNASIDFRPYLYPSSTVDIYDVSTNTWNSTENGAGSLGVPRALLAAASAGNKIIFAGGILGRSNAYSAVDIYDVVTGIWISSSSGAGSLSSPRVQMAVAVVGSKVLFAGGSNGLLAPFAYRSIDIYDSANGTWSSVLSGLTEPRTCLAAAAVGNLVLFAGGIAPYKGGASDVVDYFYVTEVKINSSEPTDSASPTAAASTSPPHSAATSASGSDSTSTGRLLQINASSTLVTSGALCSILVILIL